MVEMRFPVSRYGRFLKLVTKIPKMVKESLILHSFYGLKERKDLLSGIAGREF